MKKQHSVDAMLQQMEEKHIPKALKDAGYWMACPLCGATDVHQGSTKCRHCGQMIKE